MDMTDIERRQYGDCELFIAPDRTRMGQLAAGRAIAALRQRLADQARVRLVFAAAPSQNEFLDALVTAEGIDWARVEALHMDEYVGLETGHPASFRHFLEQRVFSRVPFGAVHYIDDGSGADPLPRYTAILAEAPIDIVLMGIGENGHIAFNDPPVADFDDPLPIKRVRLDAACRQQQVNDGCFPDLDHVPEEAWTLTIPTLVAPPLRFSIVPTALKAPAIRDTLEGPIATSCPASILRRAPRTELFVDRDAASLLS